MSSLLARGGMAFLLAAGPAVPADQARAAAPALRRVAFACPGGQILVVAFDTADPGAPAVVEPPGGPAVTLPVLPHADGIRYGDTNHELRGRGRAVTWTEAGRPPVACAETQPGP